MRQRNYGKIRITAMTKKSISRLRLDSERSEIEAAITSLQAAVVVLHSRCQALEQFKADLLAAKDPEHD